MQPLPLFSVSIICKNEEGSIGNLHNSLKPFIAAGGEVVIVDTGSTDKTIEVLRSLGYKQSSAQKDYINKLRYYLVGSKFIINLEDHLENINKTFIDSRDQQFTKNTADSGIKLQVFDFCAARRYAGSLCTNKWILSIDADEVCSTLDVSAINALISSGQFTQLSFTFRYRSIDGVNINSVTSRDKLYDSSVSNWKWLVHEQVKPLTPTTPSTIGNIPENVLSVDHYQHEAEHRSNYLLSMCVDVMKDPNDQHVWWLGRDLHYRGYHHSAIALLKKYLIDYPQAWSAEKCMACVCIGDACFDIISKKLCKDDEISAFEVEGLTHYFKGVCYEKEFREPWLKLGYYYFFRNEFRLAITFINSALTIEKINQNYMNDYNFCYGPTPFIRLYISLYGVGNKNHAFQTWKKAKSIFPDVTEITDHSILFADM